MCQKYQICHVINNAYGIQSSKITHLVNESVRLGRVDAVVQSKNQKKTDFHLFETVLAGKFPFLNGILR